MGERSVKNFERQMWTMFSVKWIFRGAHRCCDLPQNVLIAQHCPYGSTTDCVKIFSTLKAA